VGKKDNKREGEIARESGRKITREGGTERYKRVRRKDIRE
jgi:hypothetical protein